jgi:hypothetical protein
VLQIGVGRRSGTHAQYSLKKNVAIFGRISASPLHAEEPTVIWSSTRWKKSPLSDKLAKHATNTFEARKCLRQVEQIRGHLWHISHNGQTRFFLIIKEWGYEVKINIIQLKGLGRRYRMVVEFLITYAVDFI